MGRATEPSPGARVEATFPNHTTTVLHGVGHFLQSDAPAEFSQAIETWWAELTP